MTPGKDFRAGQRQLSADQLNQILAEVRALAGMQGTGGVTVERAGGAFQVTHVTPSAGFWAKIGAEGTGSNKGRYAWTEQRQKADGTFEDLEAGRSGTAAADYARSPNGAEGVPEGEIVWLVPGNPTPDSAAEGGVRTNWLFEASGWEEIDVVVGVCVGLVPIPANDPGEA